jgi:hypothetical protein
MRAEDKFPEEMLEEVREQANKTSIEAETEEADEEEEGGGE